MKKIIPLIIIASILIMPMVLAVDLIADSKITIKAHNSTKYVNNSVIVVLEITNSDYSVNNRNFTLNVSTNKAVSNTYEFLFQMAKNTSGSIDTCQYDENTTKCYIDKGKLDIGFQQCTNTLQEYKNGSYDCNLVLNNCQNSVGDKQSEIDTLNSQIADLNEEQKNTKNSKWLFLAIGFALGLLAYAFKEGKLNKITDKSYREFNRGSTG